MKSSAGAFLLLACYIPAWTQGAVRPEQPSAPPSFEELLHTIRTGNAYQRAQAIAPLSQIEDPRVVPELIALLRDEDAGVRTYSSQGLARLADKRSVDALAAALFDPTRNVRCYAAEGLAKIGDERHVPALVASVLSHLPVADTEFYDVCPASAALTAIANLSSKAPSELIALMAGVPEGGTMEGEPLWRLRAGVAECLGQIGDQAAHGALLQALKTLEQDHQDYRAWYAVRKALAALDPVKMAFDRPAAGILDSQCQSKVSEEDVRKTWVLPLAKLGREAVADLSWALQFESRWDRDRLKVAVEALGEIGGEQAAEALRRYVAQQSRVPERERRNKRTPLRATLLALLKADPNETTVAEVARSRWLLDSFEEEYFLGDTARVPPEKIPGEIKIAFYESILLDNTETSTLVRPGASVAAALLGRMGGRQAGEILRTALLSPPVAGRKDAAARALGTIQDYDAVPALMEAAALADSPKGAIAWALGMIADRRAIPALRDMAGREGLYEPERFWIAAALARLDVDYAQNAGLIRQALPQALEQARWLHDEESIRAIATFVPAGGYTTELAIAALEAIGTDRALNALTGRIDLGTATDPMHLEQLSRAAARMAQRLGHPSAGYWAGVTATAQAVQGWFVVSQVARPSPEPESSLALVLRHPDLARRIWIVEANRRLDLAAAGNAGSLDHAISTDALSGAEAMYGPELVPTLERIIRESDAAVDFGGKDRVVRHYYVRSQAARILTDKTGQVYTFVDADGRTRPGGWNPYQPDNP
jgi:HEAT repeat protein